MVLGWEMDDVTRRSGFAAIEDEHPPKSQLPCVALSLVSRKRIGVSPFEFERDAFSHDANAVHSISDGLNVSIEQVTANKLDHLFPHFTTRRVSEGPIANIQNVPRLRVGLG